MTNPGPCWCAGEISHHADEPCTERDHWLDVEDSELDETTPAHIAQQAASRDADRKAREAKAATEGSAA